MLICFVVSEIFPPNKIPKTRYFAIKYNTNDQYVFFKSTTDTNKKINVSNLTCIGWLTQSFNVSVNQVLKYLCFASKLYIFWKPIYIFRHLKWFCLEYPLRHLKFSLKSKISFCAFKHQLLFKYSEENKTGVCWDLLLNRVSLYHLFSWRTQISYYKRHRTTGLTTRIAE